MPAPRGGQSIARAFAVLLTMSAGTAYAQKTDVVTLRNGDRITGTVRPRSGGASRPWNATRAK